MRIMMKLATALRGGLREGAEGVIDANGLRIFAQEIHECEGDIKQSKQQLAAIIAEKSRVKRELDQLSKNMQLKEAKITQLLADNKELEALRVAELIAQQQPTLERQQQHYQQLSSNANALQQSLKKMVARLSTYRSEYQMLQATDNLQLAQRKLSTHSNSTMSKFVDMQDSLSRIQQRQQQFTDEMNAMEQVESYLDGSDIGSSDSSHSARDILETIRNKSPL